MRSPRGLAAMIVGVAVPLLLTGCGAPAATAQPGTPPAATSAPGAPAGGVLVDGDVHTPGPVTPAQLAGMPQHTESVQFGSAKGNEAHSETGVLLADLLPVTARGTTSRKNDQLAFAVLATGADGYAAVDSYGEISPEFGNRGILLATRQDGRQLTRPRLVVPGDLKGGRYVSDVVTLHVSRVG